MKKVLLPLIFIATSLSSALAADLPSRKGAPAYAPPPPVMSWTGFYAGLSLGGGWGAGNGNSNYWNLNGWNGGVTNNISGGIIGGGQVGYNYQITPMFLVGAEADFQGTSMGGGAEWMFMPNWSAKAEYLYTDLAGGNMNEYGWNAGVGLNNVNNHSRWNTVRAGVNYHFNLGPTPGMPAF